MPYKVYRDSYLMSLPKTKIIELLRTAEHNYLTTEEALNNSAKAGQEIAEKLDRAREMLKIAVEDFKSIRLHASINGCCKLNYSDGCTACPYCTDDWSCNPSTKWRHEDEALEIIGGEQ